MYDFLCVFPHANASHSLIHYLNQHRLMHVAPFTSLGRSLNDILAYERHLRPWMNVIGAATKDYDTPEIVEKILGATKRDLVILTVRDPVQSFVAQTNNSWFGRRLRVLAGEPDEPQTIEERIADALTRYITPAEAERAYQMDTFKRRVVVDIEDLKGDKCEGAVSALWEIICGDADPANLESRYFRPMGSRSYASLRTYGAVKVPGNFSRPLALHAVAEGDLWTEYYYAEKNIYFDKEVVLATYPDINALAPALKLQGSLQVRAFGQDWAGVHRSIRAPILKATLPALEDRVRRFNDAFAEAEKAMTFTLEELTPLQAEILKAGLEEDYAAFHRRHPAVAERWTVTRTFLGV